MKMSMTAQDIRNAIAADPALQALAADRNDGAIAAALSATLPPEVVPRHLTERGVRALPVSPRSRHALLQTLRDAAVAAPPWLAPTLTALGIPAEDHAAMADDLASAHRWLLDADGIDVGTSAARSMLDLIAATVPAAAPACAAVKALAEVTAVLPVSAVSAALNEDI